MKANTHLESQTKNIWSQSRLKIKGYAGKYGILIGFIAICIFLSFASPVFLTSANLINILKQVSIIGIVSMGMTMIIISGGIDLSVGSILALTSVVVAVCAQNSIPLILCILIAIAVGGLAGMINGYVTAKGAISPFIVTLGMMTVARGIALIISNGMPVSGLPETFFTLGSTVFLGLPLPVYIFFLMIFVTTILLKKTRFGRHLYAIGGNEQAALVSGINITKVKVWVYVIGGLLTGLAGVVLAARVGAGQPNAAVGYELDAIAAVVIGGVSFSGGLDTH